MCDSITAVKLKHSLTKHKHPTWNHRCYTLSYLLMSSHALSCSLLPSRAPSYLLMPSHALSCSLLCPLLPSHALSCSLLPSHAPFYLLMPSHALSCSLLPPSFPLLPPLLSCHGPTNKCESARKYFPHNIQ